jgi:hypothetical protein
MTDSEVKYAVIQDWAEEFVVCPWYFQDGISWPKFCPLNGRGGLSGIADE